MVVVVVVVWHLQIASHRLNVGVLVVVAAAVLIGI